MSPTAPPQRDDPDDDGVRAVAHWVATDPRPVGRLAATASWSSLLSELVPRAELLELTHALVVAGRSVTLAGLADALEELGDHAERALDAHEQAREVALAERPVSIDEQTFCVAVQRCSMTLDAAIALLGARLRDSDLPPLDKLYPAELVRQLVSAPGPSGKPLVRTIAAEVEALAPAAWAEVTHALHTLDARTGAHARWPGTHEAGRAARALQTIEPLWERQALLVQERVRRAGKLSSGARRDLTQALEWAVATRHTLQRLASPQGWLRLLLDYLLELRAGVGRIIEEARRDAPTSTFIDITMHELAHVVRVVRSDAAATERALLDRDTGPDASRTRLSRGRDRCLSRWHLVEPDAEWDAADFDALLAELDAQARAALEAAS